MERTRRAGILQREYRTRTKDLRFTTRGVMVTITKIKTIESRLDRVTYQEKL